MTAETQLIQNVMTVSYIYMHIQHSFSYMHIQHPFSQDCIAADP